MQAAGRARHSASFPVGRAVELREERDGLHAAFEISDTTRDGDDVLTLVRDGIVDSFSHRLSRRFGSARDDGVRVHRKAALSEVSAVTFPAYPGAAIAGVRSQQLVIPRAVAQARRSLMDW